MVYIHSTSYPSLWLSYRRVQLSHPIAQHDIYHVVHQVRVVDRGRLARL
jgi:hypothetical protein